MRQLSILANEPVPVLATVDTVVVHGTLAACVAARALAHAGRKVVLASSACSVPFEIVVCRRPWITESEMQQLPGPFEQAFLDSIVRTLPGGEHLLNLSQLAIRVEDLLIDAGVQLFYGMIPCGVVTDSNHPVNGVVFGGKFGLQAISAGQIIDATATAMIPRLAGYPPASRLHDRTAIDVALGAKVNVNAKGVPVVANSSRKEQDAPMELLSETVLKVAGVTELVGGRIDLHGPYADVRLRMAVDPADPLWYPRLTDKVRSKLLQIGAAVQIRREALGQPPVLFHRFAGGLLTEPLTRIQAASRDEPARPAGLENVWVCGPAADVDDAEAAAWANPYEAATRAAVLAESVRRHPAAKFPCAALIARVSSAVPPPASHGPLILRFTDTPPLHTSLAAIPLENTSLPILGECEVLVAGGGTSGVPAAMAAAGSGADTILLEQQDDVGGTHTVGGVGNYWFGRETPFHSRYNRACNEAAADSGMAMEIAMRRQVHEAGVTLMTGCATVGVVMEGDRIRGVVVATDRGMGVMLGKIVIDATGDADLAAWAGAPFEYGNGRDAWTYWASFANFNEEKRTASRQYESSIEVRDPFDFTRTIVTGRRRQGMWKSYAHEMPQLYVAPRESRRIRGEATVTYRGILAGETCEDLVTVCESNFDIKGIATSDLICSGVIWSWNTFRNYRAAVPFRAILPHGVENLLVVGKAYSTSHDALALARMQRDMGCLGASAGIAAAQAVQLGTSLHELDIHALQQACVEIGSLFAADLRWAAKHPRPYRAADVERDVKALLKGNHVPERLARLVQSKENIGPLRRAFDDAGRGPLKVKIARALCYLGDTSTVEFLLDTVAEQVQQGLPRSLRRTIAIPPEHGWAGDPVYSLYAISLTDRGADTAPLLERVAAQVADDAASFTSKTHSPFEYVRVICAVAERHPGPVMMPALETLLAKRCLRELSVRYDADLRLTVDSVAERRAYLELCLGRALARCGDRRGYEILLRYTDDVRGALARSAVDELVDLLGEPGQRDAAGWAALIDERAADAGVKPFLRRIA